MKAELLDLLVRLPQILQDLGNLTVNIAKGTMDPGVEFR